MRFEHCTHFVILCAPFSLHVFFQNTSRILYTLENFSHSDERLMRIFMSSIYNTMCSSFSSMLKTIIKLCS